MWVNNMRRKGSGGNTASGWSMIEYNLFIYQARESLAWSQEGF